LHSTIKRWLPWAGDPELDPPADNGKVVLDGFDVDVFTADEVFQVLPGAAALHVHLVVIHETALSWSAAPGFRGT